jgi:RNA polymerase sigma-70 factor (ECF subfamily)
MSTNRLPTDEELATRAARPRTPASALSAAQQAFDALYERHARPLLAFLAGRVRRSDLGDVSQVVWQRVWEHLEDKFDGGSFRGWLFQIARNYLIDLSRRKQPVVVEQLPDRTDDKAKRPDEVFLGREQQQLLQRCLERLPAKQAELVRGRLGGEDYEEVGSRLGLTPAQAHKLFHTAKTALQACVQRAEQ